MIEFGWTDYLYWPVKFLSPKITRNCIVTRKGDTPAEPKHSVKYIRFLNWRFFELTASTDRSIRIRGADLTGSFCDVIKNAISRCLGAVIPVPLIGKRLYDLVKITRALTFRRNLRPFLLPRHNNMKLEYVGMQVLCCLSKRKERKGNMENVISNGVSVVPTDDDRYYLSCI